MKTSDKLKIFAKKKFGSVSALAEAMGISQPSIAQYTSGKRGIGNKQIERLRDLGCDINWLLSEDDEPMPEETGGRQYRYESNKNGALVSINRALREVYGKRLFEWITETEKLTLEKAAKKLNMSIDLLKEYISGRRNAAELTSQLHTVGFDAQWILTGQLTEIVSNFKYVGKGMKMYPVIAKVYAGDPAFVYIENNISGYEGTTDYTREYGCFWVQVEGDSMDGMPKPLKHGDLVLVDMNETPLDGDIVVAIVKGRQVIKQYFELENQIKLHSFNPSYGPALYTKTDVECIYRCVYKQSRGERI